MAKLGDQAIGSIVKLNVNGTATNFIVVHQGLPSSVYDSSCDGTWLLMEDLYESRAFDSTNHDYANSDIHSYLNNTFVNLFDSDIKSAINQVKIPYRAGSGSSTTVTSGSSGLSAKVFLLSYTEVGFSGNSYAPVEGAVLSYFNGAADSKRVAKLNGTATRWWLRSPGTINASSAWSVDSDGSDSNYYVTRSVGVRPALVLPLSLPVSSDGTISVSKPSIGQVTIGGTQKELTGLGYANIGGVWKELVKSYVNVGGVWKEPKPFLPIGYTRLEYIQSSGSQYIDTGFKPNGNTRVLMDYESLATSTAFVFGSRHNSHANSGSYSFSFVILGASSIRSDYGSVESGITGSVLKQIVLDKNKNVTTYDGTTVTATAQTFQSSYNMYLCSVNTAGTAGAKSSIKIYSCQIYDNGTLVRDFVPCMNASGAVGLYDVVNGVFYANAGSGAFTAGPAVA